MKTRSGVRVLVSLAVAGVVAMAGMAAYVATSNCFADLYCDNLGVAWSALTVGAALLTLVLMGGLMWALSSLATDQLRRAASAATVTAGVLGAVWGLIWLLELVNPLPLIFPIVSLAPLPARSTDSCTFHFVVVGTLGCLYLSALALFVWYLPMVIVQTGLLTLAMWARH